MSLNYCVTVKSTSCLVESCRAGHDSNSAVIGRLQGAGFNVLHRPRQHTVDDTSPNHGGVVVVVALPASSSRRCRRRCLTSRRRSCWLTSVSFLDVSSELSLCRVVLDQPPCSSRSSTNSPPSWTVSLLTKEPIYVIGDRDFNIRLDRVDPSTRRIVRPARTLYTSVHVPRRTSWAGRFTLSSRVPIWLSTTG